MGKGLFILRYRWRDKHWSVETLGGHIVETRRTMLAGMQALKRWQQGRINAIQVEAAADGRRAFEEAVRVNARKRLKAKREKPR